MLRAPLAWLAALWLCASTLAAVAGEVRLTALADGVWLHTSYGTLSDGTQYPSNGLLVREGNGLLLVDTAWGEANTDQLLRLIDAELSLPLTRAVVTHSHDDRASGIALLRSRGVPVFAHPLTASRLAAAGQALPDRVVSELAQRGEPVALGAVELLYPGHGHAPDNIVVWVPAAQLLYGGCAVRALESSSAGNTADADLGSWVSAVALLSARYSPQQVVPGHGAVGGPELLPHTATVVAAAGNREP